MSKSKPSPLLLRLMAPFGRIGHMLGFRWVFPVSTLPVPYHPLILPLAVAALGIAAIQSAFAALTGSAEGQATWIVMLGIAAVLGLLLSLPVVVWFLLPFAVHLIQGVLVLVAMVLLAIEVLAGRASPLLGVLPAAYAALFVVQRLGGLPWWRRLEAEAQAFAPQPTGQATVAFAEREHSAETLIAGRAIARLFEPGWRKSETGRMLHWLRPDDAETLRAAFGEHCPREWKFQDRDGAVLLTRPCDRPDGEAITLSRGRLRTPLWLVTGLSELAARGPAGTWRMAYGKAQVVGWLPTFSFFRFTSISGPQHNSLHLGFPRKAAGTLPTPERVDGHELGNLLLPRGGDGELFDEAGLAGLHAIIAEEARIRAARRKEAIANLPAYWQRVADDQLPKSVDLDTHSLLTEESERIGESDVPLILTMAERARDNRDMLDLLRAAALLQAAPLDRLQPHLPRIEALLNSRKLALQWDVSKVHDVASLPKETPLFAGNYAGFGLYLSRPELYARLAGISPALARVDRSLQERVESGEPGLLKSSKLIVSRRRRSKA